MVRRRRRRGPAGALAAGALAAGALAGLAAGALAAGGAARAPGELLQSWPLEVELPGGAGGVRGAQQGGHQAWWGIPYGAPPTGARRFAPPEPAVPWKGTRDCSGGRDPARKCSRSDLKWSALLDPRKKPRAVGSEDCLSLDVYRPALG